MTDEKLNCLLLRPRPASRARYAGFYVTSLLFNKEVTKKMNSDVPSEASLALPRYMDNQERSHRKDFNAVLQVLPVRAAGVDKNRFCLDFSYHRVRRRWQNHLLLPVACDFRVCEFISLANARSEDAYFREKMSRATAPRPFRVAGFLGPLSWFILCRMTKNEHLRSHSARAELCARQKKKFLKFQLTFSFAITNAFSWSSQQCPIQTEPTRAIWPAVSYTTFSANR